MCATSRGVNSEEFNPKFRSDAWRARFGIGPSDTLVTFVGRIAPEKNLEILLDAWQELALVRGNAQLVLVGDGLLVENIRARRIPGVHLLGYLHGIELATAYASSDVFAFPSGTGSQPVPPQGWHRASRRGVSHVPRPAPGRSRASRA